MLILTRRPGDTVLIEPRPEALESDLCTVFTRPIAVRILRVQGNHVRIGIDAPEGLLITREERREGA
jgi:sRNA-binding carbon storage regulator CsrA